MIRYSNLTGCFSVACTHVGSAFQMELRVLFASMQRLEISLGVGIGREVHALPCPPAVQNTGILKLARLIDSIKL